MEKIYEREYYLIEKIRNGYNKNGNKEYEILDGKGDIKKCCYYDKLGFEGEDLNREKKRKRKKYFYNDNLKFKENI